MTSHINHHGIEYSTSRLTERFQTEPFALVFSGQGLDWLDTFKDAVAHGAGRTLEPVMSRAEELLQPVRSLMAGTNPFGFDPIAWSEAESVSFDLAHPALSVPGIFLAQLAVLDLLEAQGLNVENAAAHLGHSQGVLGVYALKDLSEAAEILAIARLVGAAVTRHSAHTGLISEGEQGPMLAISGVNHAQLSQIIDQSCHDIPLHERPHIGLKNSRDSFVLVGRPEDNQRVRNAIIQEAQAQAQARDNKETGGAVLQPQITVLPILAGFHHPLLAPGVEDVAQWAALCGLDAQRARDIARQIMVDPIDWPHVVLAAYDQGARWFLDIGPDSGMVPMTEKILEGLSARSFAVAPVHGQALLFDAGADIHLPQPYSDFAPQLVERNGTLCVSTKFTRLTGYSPTLLAGMTPTTVDPEIVAAAANAGHWAEWAGGGQVTEEIFASNLAKLTELLEPGINAQFNAMFLDPKLWRLHVAGKGLLLKARAAGAPLDGITISAGIPEPDEAVEVIAQLRAAGLPWISFKPGAVRHIRKILQIARMVPDTDIIMQIEGGKAGGHHSWEDLDDLLMTTYAEIRQTPNITLCVGGGIGTPERAAEYLTGSWARAYDLPLMPVDGILIGTAAMATLEAKTSQAVKELLVATPGISGWVGAGDARDGMASGRSQLGADIHEIDNSFARTARLLDEVAGNEELCQERREEIIAALNRTAKPYFGDVEDMTYAAWLNRYCDLSGPYQGRWVDHTWFSRFAQMLSRTEARLSPVEHGEFTPTITADADQDPRELIEQLLSTYPIATTELLHPADCAWFFDLCAGRGKPVNFVPRIDAEVRRWWRSDSLWQAQDERYPADQVAIIPGISAVAGITALNEPVARLLARFNATTIDQLQAAGVAAQPDNTCVVEKVLRSPGIFWAGHHHISLIERLGNRDQWVMGADSAYHEPSGAHLVALDPELAHLRIPLDTSGTLRQELAIRITVPKNAPASSLPIVEYADAEAAMEHLAKIASGGLWGEKIGETYHHHARLSALDCTDYLTITAGHIRSQVKSGDIPGTISGTHLNPDILVGPAWPAIFRALSEAKVPDHPLWRAVEGLLNLVHLDHHIELHRELVPPTAGEHVDLDISATILSVSDTTSGRVIEVRAEITEQGRILATLRERFAIQGRTGSQPLSLSQPAFHPTPSSFRAHARIVAPHSMEAFAKVTGDHNPIHLSDTAAKLAGLHKGVIVHGMWTSAIAQHIASAQFTEGSISTPAAEILDYQVFMQSPLLPGETVDFTVVRIGVDERDGYGEVREITASVNDRPVLKATATMKSPSTFYAFPGQGIQSVGMGMVQRQKSAAARRIWDRADHHTRTQLGFSILEIVRNNPPAISVGNEVFTHPEGVLYLTQFTQVAMACLAVAQIAELDEAHTLENNAYFAGHSVGEYTALAAYSHVITLENVVEIVYQRGLTMHRLVERDEKGNSQYGLAALRPHKMGLSEETVFDYISTLSQSSGEFLEIVNYNLAGKQYAVAGTMKGLHILAADAEQKAPGQRALIIIPGIDVPFHSTHLLNGVADFREHLESLLPEVINTEVLVGKYIPNLVARPFELTQEFVGAILDVVDAPILHTVLEQWEDRIHNPGALARTILVELLAWQFASPVRWIETQDLILRPKKAHGLGIQRFIEVGVGHAPTLANLMAQTAAMDKYQPTHVDILNVERDAAQVFAREEYPAPAIFTDASVEDKPETEAPQPAVIPAPQAAIPAHSTQPRPEDLNFGAAEATRTLIALWAKVRPDQMAATDTIEQLVEGVSSRRNQLLLDLGLECNLGSIDGAADSELSDLYATTTRLSKNYQPFGPVLSTAIEDALRRLTGPASQRPSYISERITKVWELGPGWVYHATAALVLGARDGSSIRGGDLATLKPSSPNSSSELDQLIDAAVQSVATDHGLTVSIAQSDNTAGAGVNQEAVREFTESITGDSGVLAATARTILTHLGLEDHSHRVDLSADATDQELFDLVASELGSDWPRTVAPRFDPATAVLIDDRWASAREDISRVHLGHISAEDLDLRGAGESVAQQAEYFGLDELAAQARDMRPLQWETDIAVVTGASPQSIAARVLEGLLHHGATVIATTSSLDHQRLEFYKELYARSARGSAALWVVPANLSSFSDIDQLSEWIATQRTAQVNGETKVIKPAYKPTVLFPFAAPRVSGTVADAGPEAEKQMRLLLWSVERLIATLSRIGIDTHIGQRMHIVLPGSPNRGIFGADGAYGEAKAALDALVNRWVVEDNWKNHTSLAHVLIGWVRGTGLMAHNDPLVSEVERAGVSTFSTTEIASILLDAISTPIRDKACHAPQIIDATGGLSDANLDLAALARAQQREDKQEISDTPSTIKALPSPYRPLGAIHPDFTNQVSQNLDEMVVIVGAGELGPLGSSRTRFDAEISGDLSAAGVVELAWSLGLIHWDHGWLDQDDHEVDEAEIYERYHDEVLARIGIRRFYDDFGMVDNLAPELTTIHLDSDVSFHVADAATAKTYVDSAPETTSAECDPETGEWRVVRHSGSPIYVPRRMAMSRFVGGQIPEGFDPATYGIPADMIDNLDRVAVWNLVATIDAFLSSGFSPAELLGSLHPARVSSTQGTGLGGMQAMRSLYIDGLLAQPRANDILQEALPNVMAAHVMQGYVGGYGQMIHPVAACATAAVSVEEGVDKIKLGKSDFVVAGGYDDLSIEGITGFGDMAATANSKHMVAQGIEERFFSRANDRRRGGFVESAGGGTILLARASLAYEMGLPVLGVVGFAESFADGAHTSIPAPGLGALGAARGSQESRLVTQLAAVGVSADDIRIISKHDTSTHANDPNESDLHEKIAHAIGRSPGNPLYVISQKSLTGHAKGGAAAFQIIGLTQTLRTGIIPANRSLDCVDPVLRQHQHLVWLRSPLDLSEQPAKAGLVTSLGFGHVSALIAIVHPAAFVEAVRRQYGEDRAEHWQEISEEREIMGLRRILNAMHGGKKLYERPVDRNLGATGEHAKQREAAVLLSPTARLVNGILEV
ncbi:type I polyketide synthase [Corynebacterium sp. ES2715-CONJ3]|uniref:type I polyketide synthase n=1 Tax=Corynebacterium sp. ES2715-CONJ3 TaxID=2974028 RepID=UPI002166DC18|nr:type I polyketide synthase [Corynebacterium sp. ES2715-CONJ3]MCS4492468.1 DUF1729 domain-containing protein [Corynebacterium sp. ES2715-CONJ3]